MNLLPNDSNNINEVVFKNRNKSYGAYAIRKAYNSSIAKSLMYLSSLLVLIFGSAFTYNNLTYTLPEVNVVAFDDPNIIDSLYVTPIDVTPIEPVIPVEETAAPVGITTPTTIVDETVEATPTGTTMVAVAGLGEPDAVGTSTTSTVTSTETVAVIHVETPASSEVLPFAEQMPEFNTEKNGILNYVASHISYPEMARNIGIEGTVHVSFVVNEFGKVENMKILKGIGYGCDEEVVRMLSKMPTWMKPGKNGNKAVKVRFNIPVRFKLK